ncbi:EscF/YscF/HrpA family type III secretion system needle major subunit [Citrobacter amalonaticus]|uniref:EscF/YscF/HrpA family type III secretion system needle major subunit n=1 Tax=Citrobacter amalonaticus TaxID=35703 RepID=A0A2S4S2K5_CITAM|nr:type III secretion system needle filament subunit SctF [Citrobacter amalonaticus]POT59514.1 EscF/YscF/HrpA family type III secretion system needle major subunit [Citrobacter amalonaticus]POT77644.1 EscF/YscF/HrpA family type III secretion system needle major subunit [Citrobacter amalonaticus]POU68096.1 EscF/YscF/HrpA family type III secretion system needle major subunit [Citrobacter amalonaticus]POV07700.1 EscF/YscF/HrpA family type III secretion system needle major subunit [Citrobacter amal
MAVTKTPVITPVDGGENNRYIEQTSNNFEKGVVSLQEKLTNALTALQADASDPKLLADYQSALSAYTLFRNAQSNVVKAFRDIDQAIIANYK